MELTNEAPQFTAGKNIALKTPTHEFEKTVSFYRDVLKLPVLGEEGESIFFEFGDKQLWVDNIPHLSQAEIWLEIRCDDIPAAEAYLEKMGVMRRDEIEPLPEGFDGFWVSSSSGIIHLISS